MELAGQRVQHILPMRRRILFQKSKKLCRLDNLDGCNRQPGKFIQIFGQRSTRAARPARRLRSGDLQPIPNDLGTAVFHRRCIGHAIVLDFIFDRNGLKVV
jgi:hypothetical protein